MANGDSPLERLSRLVNDGKPLSEEEAAEMEETDQETVKVINDVLRYVSQQPGCDDIFTAQELVEACAEELRNQIRERWENGDGETG